MFGRPFGLFRLVVNAFTILVLVALYFYACA